MKIIIRQCCAPVSTGHWKGYRCGNEGVYLHNKNGFCYAHIKKAEMGEYDGIDTPTCWRAAPK